MARKFRKYPSSYVKATKILASKEFPYRFEVKRYNEEPGFETVYAKSRSDAEEKLNHDEYIEWWDDSETEDNADCLEDLYGWNNFNMIDCAREELSEYLVDGADLSSLTDYEKACVEAYLAWEKEEREANEDDYYDRYNHDEDEWDEDEWGDED